MDKPLPWIKPLQDHSISAARYPMSHHLSFRVTLLPSILTKSLCKVILAKISQSSCSSPHRQSTHAHPPAWLPFSSSSRPTHITATVLSLPLLPLPAGSTHPHPSYTTPTPSLTSCPPVDITLVLTGLLIKCPREKGKRAHCLVETMGIPNNSSWRVRAFI